MDNILGLGDVFALSANAFNPTLLIPVILVVVGAITVFIFGFKKVEGPKFRKLAETSNRRSSISSNSNPRNKKRPDGELAGGGFASSSPSGGKSTNAALVQTKNIVVTVINASKFQQQRSVKQSTKPLVKVKSSASNMKPTAAAAFIDSRNDADNGGEWQTVTTKKQKQKLNDSQSPVTVIATFSESASKTSNKSSTSSAANSVTKQNNKKRKTNETPLEAFTEIAVVSTAKCEHSPLLSDQTTISKVADEPLEEIYSKPEEEKTVVALPSNAAWSDSKPQKKNKRRAIREQ